MTTTYENAYDVYSTGNDIAEQSIEQSGFRKVQHMNESTTYHRGSLIERGGYAIKDEDGTAPNIGTVETIKHRGNNSSIMRVATEIDVALIGWSPKYFQIKYDDPAGAVTEAGFPKHVFLNSDHYIAPQDFPGKKGECRSAMSFFVVMKCDDKRELYELTFKGHIVSDATASINQARGYGQKAAQWIAAQANKNVVAHPFLCWLTLGVGDSKMVGKVEQSAVTPPAWKVNGDDISAHLVSGDDFRRFVELRKELDAYLATGRYGGVRQQPAAQIAAPVARFRNEVDPSEILTGDVNI